MSLLQISEPDASPDPHQRRLAVGIDLGTTHSLVATVRSGVSEVITDAKGRGLLPSIVRYRPDGAIVGVPVLHCMLQVAVEGDRVVAVEAVAAVPPARALGALDQRRAILMV